MRLSRGAATVFQVSDGNPRGMYVAVLSFTNILSLTGQRSLTIFLFIIDYWI
ncbi:MAG: hypothetical protein LBC68_05885 [Prevotellaceae bacterium]|nr:hypothetical protein [Prevotellaceae bacterium]